MTFLGELLNNFSKVSYAQIRTLKKKRPLMEKPSLPEEGGIKYFGFTYYPRTPDFKDPPYEPTKLFLIKRIKSMSGRNPLERRILDILNIDGLVKFQKHIAIVKNIPEVNALLWRVKHLVQITPIRFVNGLPKDGDFTGTYLRDNGEFIVSEKIKVDEKVLEATENFINDKKKLDAAYLKEYLRLRLATLNLCQQIEAQYRSALEILCASNMAEVPHSSQQPSISVDEPTTTDKKSNKALQKRYMKLLHEYNEIKDAAQVILGAIANIEGITVKDVHKKFNLPLDE